MPTLITSARFNTLQDRIAAIIGTSTGGAPTTGYGETLESSADDPVITGVDKITAQQWNNLYIDFSRARAHQVGAGFSIDPLVIGDFLANGGSTDKPLEAFIINLEALMTDIETDKFLINIPTQASIEPLVSSNTSSGWNSVLTHIATITFSSELSRRHYFNAGGEIRFDANIVYAGSDPKTLEWKSMLSTMGVISFDHDATFSNNGIGSGSAIGNYDLTGVLQTVYQRNASSYSGNNYNIAIRNLSTTEIQASISFNDGATGIVDELVQGTLTSNISLARPDGSVTINGTPYDTVVVAAPGGANTSTL